ncbi:hypothetical protein QCA50_011712 [Cerrena zonata]|uniref:Uncharacterized protein n=1 Tax=Cerrena zonata TaxID=2478898 RepID=A0AAW0FWA4_9APHY
MSAVNQQPLSNELHFCSLHELNEYLASLQRNPDILKRLNRNLTIIFRFYLGLTPSIQSNHTFHKICEDFCAMIPSLLEHPEIQVKTLVFDGHMPQDSEIRNRILQTIERKLDGTTLSLNFQRCVLDSAEALTDWLQVLHTKLRTLTVFHMTRGPLFGMMQTPSVSSLTELELRLPDNAEWQLYFALISHAPHLRTLRLSADFIQDEGVIRSGCLLIPSDSPCIEFLMNNRVKLIRRS